MNRKQKGGWVYIMADRYRGAMYVGMTADLASRIDQHRGGYGMGKEGEYVVKNVERLRTGEVRIFSTNQKYQNESAPSETTRNIGRPVWFGRRR